MSTNENIDRRSFSKKIVAAAVFGMLAGTTGMSAYATGGGDRTVQYADDKKEGAEKNVCKGHNACKGKGGCKAGDAGCAGKNSCKGKGGCATAEKHSCKGQNACKGQGGCKSGEAGCAGKNACKGKGGCAVPMKAAAEKK
jgi:hypothetical protein